MPSTSGQEFDPLKNEILEPGISSVPVDDTTREADTRTTLEKFGDAYSAGVEDNHIAIQAYRMHELSAEGGIEEGFNLTYSQVKKDFADRGIPVRWIDEVTDSFNSKHYAIKLRHLAERATNDNTIANAGGTGIAAFLAASMTDPVGLAVDATVGLGFGKVRAGMKGIALAGAAGGATNAAIGMAQASTNPDYDLSDTMIDVAAGFTLSSLFAIPGALRQSRLDADVARTVQDGIDNLNGIGTPDRPRILSVIDSERTRLRAEGETINAQVRAGEAEVSVLERTHAERRAEVVALEREAAGHTKAAGGRLEKGLVPEIKRAIAQLRKEHGEIPSGTEAVKKLSKILQKTSARLTNRHAKAAATKELAGRASAVEARIVELEAQLGGNTAAAQSEQALAGTNKALAAKQLEVESAAKAVETKRAELKAKGDSAKLDDVVRQLNEVDAVSRNVDATDAELIASLPPEAAAALSRLRPVGEAVDTSGAFGADTLSAARVEGYVEPGTIDLPERGNATLRETLSQGEQDGLADITDLGHNSWFARLRIDLSAVTDRLLNPKHRVFMRKLTSSALGVARGETNVAGAVERTNRTRMLMNGQFHRDFGDAFEGFLKEMGLGDTSAVIGKQLSLKHRQTFSERVGDLLHGGSDPSPSIRAGAEAMSKASDDAWARQVKAGVHGVDPNGKVSGYMTRKVRDDIDDLIATRFGNETNIVNKISTLFERGIASALHAAGKEIDAGTTVKVARHYAELVLRKNSPSNLGGKARMLGDVKLDYIDEVLEEAGIGREEIDRIIFGLDAAAPVNAGTAVKYAKQRLPMDLQESIRLDDGSEFKLAHLFENNAERLQDNYIREVSGHIGLAEVGFKDARDVDKYVDEIASELGKKGEGEAAAVRAIVNSVLGRSLEARPLAAYARGVRMALDWNFLRSMGAVGWSMIAENGKIIGTLGIRTTFKMMPEMAAIAREVASGKMDDLVARQMAAMWEPGTTMLRGSTNLRPDDLNIEGLAGKVAGGIDRAAQVAKRLQAIASGLSPINDFQQKFISRGFTQNLAEIAQGTRKLDNGLRSRMRDWGMTDEMQDQMITHFRDNAVMERGILKDMAPDKMGPGLEDQMSMMMFRMNRHAIAEFDIGATPLWMHSTTGRIMTQFRGFSLGGWTRGTLHGLAHHDQMAAAQFLWSLPFAAAAYYGRIHANYWNEPDRLEKALDPATMTRNVFAMTADASLIPMLWDTAGSLVGADPAFSYNRSSQLASNAWLGIPSVDLTVDLARASNTLAKSVKGEVVSQQDMQNAMGLIWLNKLNGIKQGLAVFADQFPDEYDQR